MPRYTEGRWYYHWCTAPEDYEIRDSLLPNEGRLIATVYQQGESTGANARLIAASENMVSCLCALYGDMTTEGSPLRNSPFVVAIQQALMSALGPDWREQVIERLEEMAD